jgi:hypothetical protein
VDAQILRLLVLDTVKSAPEAKVNPKILLKQTTNSKKLMKLLNIPEATMKQEMDNQKRANMLFQKNLLQLMETS